MSFLRGLRLILCWTLRMNASVKVEKSVPFGMHRCWNMTMLLQDMADEKSRMIFPDKIQYCLLIT